MNQIQRATNIAEGRILDSLESQEESDKAEQEFISNFVKTNRKLYCNDVETVATILVNTEDDEQYLRLFDCIAEFYCTDNEKPLAACIDDIIDTYLTEQAKQLMLEKPNNLTIFLWSEPNDAGRHKRATVKTPITRGTDSV